LKDSEKFNPEEIPVIQEQQSNDCATRNSKEKDNGLKASWF